MSKKIFSISFSRVPKLEFPELVNTFVRIVDKYGAATMYISDTYDALKARLSQLEHLKVTDRKSKEGQVINELLKKRKDILLAYVKQNKALLKANLPSQADQMKTVSLFVNKYWNNIYKYTQKTINARIGFVLADIDSNIELKLALQAVGLAPYIDELRTVEAALSINRDALRDSKSDVPKIDSKQIKSYIGEAMTDSINAIELACKAHPQLDYMPMINEINNLFASYQSEIKAHSTYVKKAKTTTASSTTTTATAV